MNASTLTRTAALALTAVLAAGWTGAAQADVYCPRIPAQQWMPIEQAIQKAESLGYAVRQAKRTKKGCWEIEGYDRNGAEIEVHLDPASGDVVKPRGWRPPSGR